MTLDTIMWNGSVDELSSCVINNIPVDHVIFVTFLEQLYLLSLYVFVFCTYVYVCYVLWFAWIVFIQHIVYNSVLYILIQYFIV